MAIQFLNTGYFPDDAKLTFGTGSDLEIYHDGSNSYISDQGTGELKLWSSGLSIQSANGNEYLAYFSGTGSQTVSLYAGNSKKFETTSTGITVSDVMNWGSSRGTLHWGADRAIIRGQSGYVLELQSDGGTTVLVLDNSANATFSGNISTSTDGSVFTGDGTLGVPLFLRSTGSVSYLQIQNSSTGTTGTSDGMTVGCNGTAGYIWLREQATLNIGTNDTSAITIDSSQNSTFAGNVTLGSSSKVSDEWMYIDSDANSSAGIQLLRGGASKWFIYNPGGGNNFKIYDNVGGGYMEIEPVGNVTFSSNILTNTDSSSDIGTTSKRWANLWVDSINGDTYSGPYLPLAGGTMTGATSRGDSIYSYWGAGNDLEIFHNGNSFINNNGTGGDLTIANYANDKDIIFQTDDGSGGTRTYLYLDGSQAAAGDACWTIWPDNSRIGIGDSKDLQIHHELGHNYIAGTIGDLYIRNTADDKDIIFQCDDGSGGLSTYFYLDGSVVNGTSVKGATKFPDSSKIYVGSGGDLEIFHDGTNTYIENWTNSFFISQLMDDGDLVLQCDDGSGGSTAYITLDGGEGYTVAQKNIRFDDNVSALFGTSGDMTIKHDGSNSKIENNTGHLNIIQEANDKKITFYNDDGSGGTTEYLIIDGGAENISIKKSTIHPDSVYTYWGDANDFYIGHDSTNTNLINSTGHLYIANYSDDKSIYLQSDDQSGGITTYLKVDGLQGYTQFDMPARFMDNVYCQFGNSNDSDIYHNGTDMIIRNHAAAGDMNFAADSTGSGGNATSYFWLDGGQVKTRVAKGMNFEDNVKATFGLVTNPDLEIYHDGSNSYISDTGTGGLKIMGGAIYLRNPSDADMIQCQSGAQVELYYNGSKKLETTNVGATIHGNLNLNDNGHLRFGAGPDLDIYHDANDSYINNSTGNLIAQLASSFIIKNSAGTENVLIATPDGAVKLYYNASNKLETTDTGITSNR